MSTNISEIMFEMEQAGMPQARVNEIVLALITAGQQTMFASRAEEVRRKLNELDAMVVRVGMGDASERKTGLRA